VVHAASLSFNHDFLIVDDQRIRTEAGLFKNAGSLNLILLAALMTCWAIGCWMLQWSTIPSWGMITITNTILLLGTSGRLARNEDEGPFDQFLPSSILSSFACCDCPQTPIGAGAQSCAHPLYQPKSFHQASCVRYLLSPDTSLHYYWRNDHCGQGL